MFQSPVLNIENIDKGTFIGIEIEICIKKKKYEQMGYKDNESENSPQVVTPVRSYDFKTGGNLNKIILATDPTCECPEGFINAEIISPKMDYTEIPIYLDFLKKVVFNNPKNFLQGTTCGVHIHWSNEDMCLDKDDARYKFLFFKLMNNLRSVLNFKLVNSHFSGRQFFYTDDERSNDMRLLIPGRINSNYEITEELYLNVENIHKKSLTDIRNQIAEMESNVYELKPKFRTDNSIIDFIYTKISEDIELCKFLFHFVYKDFALINGIKDKYPNDYRESFYQRKLESFEDIEYEEVKLLADIKKGIENTFHPSLSLDEQLGEDFLNCFVNVITFTLFNDDVGIIPETQLKKNVEFIRSIIILLNYFQDNQPRNFSELYETFPEMLTKRKTMIFIRDENELLDYIMIGHRKSSDLSFYNIHEGFHMEMRMFSFDSLLFEKPNPPGEVIISELSRFILYSENLMVNTIKALNQAYSKTGPHDIKPTEKEMLEKTLLFGKKPNPAQVRKIGRRLFSMESVDLSTSRSLRTPVGLPGSRLKSHKKHSRATVSVENNITRRTKKNR